MGTLTLTGLTPNIFEAFNIVSREQNGMIRAVSLDSRPARAALNQVVTAPIVGAMAAIDVAPAATAPDTPNQTVNNVQLGITKSRAVPFGITGEEAHQVRAGGYGIDIRTQRIAQALRTLCNEIEADLNSLASTVSRVYGAYNGTPFATAGDLSDFAFPLQILIDNGAPGDRRMVLAGSHIANIRAKQATLFQVNTAGSEELLRNGIVGRVEGLGVGETGFAATPSVGTAANATTNNAGYAVGATVIGLATAGTGLFVAGDIVAFSGDSRKYVVASVSIAGANPASGDTITLVEPGLQQAIPASATNITREAASKRSMVFSRSSIILATRAPALPDEGDSADDRMMFTDPVTGLSFEFSLYKQYRQVRYEVALAWGKRNVMPRHTAALIGA